MNTATKKITSCAALLAICIVSQFFKNTSVYITGPIINACLVIAVLTVGLSYSLILSVITPITAFLITGNPLMSAVPLLMPCIMIGNMIFVLFISLIYNKKKGSENTKLILGSIFGSIFKTLFMGITISLVLLPMYISSESPLFKKLQVFQFNFSWTQGITAAIGCILAYFIWVPLKKAIKSES